MGEADRRAELTAIVREVRQRWRMKLAVRGAAVVVGGSVLALLLSASGLQALRFSSPAIITFRVAVFAVFCALAAYWLLGPLMRRVTDMQVALYLEERDPTLEAAILSAIEATAARAATGKSSNLVDRLVETAIDRCRALENGRRFERDAMRRHVAVLGAIVAGAALVLTFGPAYLRHGVSALLVVSRSAEAASPYRIEVAPGNASVPRGSDQHVAARLVGFTSRDVELMMRPSPTAAFEHVPLIATSDPSAFEAILFHVDKAIEYYVESNGVKSPRYALTMVDLPAVARLDLEYRFPAYTNRPPEKVEAGGDVAALKGTEVRVHIVPTMTTPGGRLLLNENEAAPLTREADGTLSGSFRIDRQGFYRIELEGPHGEHVSASPQYTIDVLDDQAPSVSFTKPGRDTAATPVEELFVEARATDDFGLKQLQLAYSVNGGAEKTVTLFGGQKPLTEISASHTIYLEELGLKPGDFVSYYARATDNDTVGGPKTGTSDIYFVQIRPFRKDYKPAQSAAGMGGGGMGNPVGGLSQQQREIVAATFNAVRDRAKTPADKFRQNVVFLTLAQAKLRQQVDELVEKMGSREVDQDPAFKKIAEALPKASVEMKTAEGNLRAQQAKDALSPEQRALKLLQDAEQEYEVQVAAMRGGGGGGANANQMADDLADLFELEMDKLANQYEMQQRADQQAQDKRIDELAERLKELARRQQQEADRQRQMMQGGAAGGGSSQRALADEAEKAARQLEQLTRDQQRPDLAETAKQLRDAADAMRRAAANGNRDGGAEAAAAEQRLRQAAERLAKTQNGRGARDIQDAMRQAQELADQQKAIQSDVQGLGQAGAGRQNRLQKIDQEKESLFNKVSDLEEQLQHLADGMRGTERDASRKLQEAAGTIRDDKIRDKIRYSKGLVQQNPEYAKSFEDEIGANLDAVKNKIGEAASAMNKASRQEAMGRALDKTRDLVRGMESLEQRMRDDAQRGRQASGQRGQNGQPSNGQPSNGQQSANGQQNASGRQSANGQQNASGQASGNAQSGDAQSGGNQAGQPGDTRGGRGAGGWNANGPHDGDWAGGPWLGWGRFSPEQWRQYQRELKQRELDAESLRRQLAEAGATPKDLDDLQRVLDDIRALESLRLNGEWAGMQQLQTSAIERLKKFEFALRKKVDTGKDELFLSGSDDVPAGFREAIEEYYRSLAKKQQ